MTGIRTADGNGWLTLVGSGSARNVWVSIDDEPQSITVVNHSSSNQSLLTDIVFVVDNSGSMSEEADAIARDIISWANSLSSSNLNILYGCVGYDVNGEISGAIDMTSATRLSQYLQRSSGTERTVGFESTNLSSLARNYSHADNECGVVAVQFADQYLNFRQGANRIYVNFTDEPNQPNGYANYSVRYFADQSSWPAGKGTIHTVYSGTLFNTNSWNHEEQPWLMSEYTGGTTLYAPSDFAGVSLSGLPVTGAMTHSYTITIKNIIKFMDGKSHRVHVTVLTPDHSVRADKVFSVVFSSSN